MLRSTRFSHLDQICSKVQLFKEIFKNITFYNTKSHFSIFEGKDIFAELKEIYMCVRFN